jgi:hypothetical protein
MPAISISRPRDIDRGPASEIRQPGMQRVGDTLSADRHSRARKGVKPASKRIPVAFFLRAW